jgi:hypothetical protein
MASKAEEITCRTLRSILNRLPIEAAIHDTQEFQDALTGLEWFLPEILAEIHPDWTGESLDGVYPYQREPKLPGARRAGVCHCLLAPLDLTTCATPPWASKQCHAIVSLWVSRPRHRVGLYQAP